MGAANGQYDPTGTAWTFSFHKEEPYASYGSGVVANGSATLSHDPPAPEGVQAGFLENLATITQAVPGWAAGSYQISFQAARYESDYPQFSNPLEDFEVLVDGAVVGQFTVAADWTYETDTTSRFTVAGGAHTIEFKGLTDALTNNVGVLLDAITVTRVDLMIGDAGFEAPALGAGNFQYAPTGTAWTFSPQNGNSGSGVAANGSNFTVFGPPAPEGGQVAFLQATGTITQATPDWAAGSYQISFEAAQRANQGISHEDFQVLVDGAVVGSFTPAGTAYQSYATDAFTVAAGSHTIAFEGLDGAGGDNTAFLDAITVAPAVVLPLGDAGFEAPAVGAGNFQYDPIGTAWTFSPQNGNSGSGVATNGSPFTGNQTAPEGAQVGFLQATGIITQASAGWAADTYQISFQAAQRANLGVSREDFRVLVDGAVVGMFMPAGTTYQSYATGAFTLAAGSHTIAFQGVDSAGGDNAVFLDAISVARLGELAVANAGFEAPAQGPGAVQYDPAGAAWTFSNTSGVAANGTPFTVGSPPAPDGAQVAFLQAAGTITQTVAGWAAGTYQISFQAAQRKQAALSREDFQVLVDGAVVDTFTPAGTAYETYATSAFTVAAGSHTIAFQGLDSAGGDNTALLDAVTVTRLGVVPVGDAGFEAAALGPGQSEHDPTGTAWTFSPQNGNSGSGVAANGSLPTGNQKAPEGTEVAFLQSTGTIAQAVTGWTAGTYQISFQAAQRANQGSSEDFQVLVDGAIVGTFTPGGTTYQTYATGPFTVAAGSHTIAFTGLDSAGDNTALLDAVTVTLVLVPAVGDAGFEAPAVGADNLKFDPTGTAWTFSPQNGDGGSGVAANGSDFTAGNPPAPAGFQVAFLQGNGTITQAVASMLVATFTDPAHPSLAAGDYTATVSWGDGETSAGTITADPAGGFDVYASKPQPYSEEGAATLLVTVSDDTDLWNQVAPLPTPDDFLAAATGPDGRIYAIGGSDSYGAVSTVSAYAPSTNTWTQVASLPVALDGPAAVTGPDGRIYAIGGLDSSFEPVSTVYAYTPSTNIWTQVASLPADLDELAAATGPDGRIYAIGGLDSHGNTVSAVYAYAPSTNTWTQVASLPEPLHHLAATTGPDGSIYALGGADASVPVSTVYAYAPSTNTWTTVADLPVAVVDPAAVTGPDGRIYAIGGLDSYNDPVSTVSAYAPSTNTWTQVASLPVALNYLAVVTGPDGRIYAIGGEDAGGHPVSTVSAYAPSTTGTASALVSIADAPLTALGTQTIATIEGQAVTNVLAARFTDTNPAATVGDFTATVAWGDGETSSTALGDVTITADPAGGFDVSASKPHPYAEEGTAAPLVTVRDEGGSTATASAMVSIADAPLHLVAQPVAAVEGLPVTNRLVGRFTDANPAGTVGDYTATVAWGDGETSSTAAGDVTITADPAGGFDVYANKPDPYAKQGAAALVVTVRDGGASFHPADTWAAVAGLPGPASSVAAATSEEGGIYAIDGAGPVYAYTPGTDTWTQAASLPAPRFELAATTGPDGLVYAIGGVDSHGNTASTVDAYNPSTNTWAAVASLPAPRALLAAVTGPDGRIYAIGGQSQNADGNAVSTVYAYTPGTDFWVQVASLPAPLYSVAAATGPDGRIYAIGGRDANDKAVSTVYAYTPDTDSWAQVASLPAPLGFLAAATGPDGRIYAIGGLNSSGVQDTVYAYAPGTDTWTQAASLPAPRDLLAAATGPDGRIYALAGRDAGGNAVSTVTAYTAIALSSATGTAMVSVAGLHVAAQPVAAVAGRGFVNLLVATFTDTDPTATPTDLTANITWGDGSNTVTTVTADGRGGFEVFGTHTYLAAGSYTFRVQITDIRGGTATATGSASVTSPAPVGVTPPAPVSVTPPSPIVRGRVALVTVLYRDLLGRNPDPSDMRYFLKWLAAGASPGRVAGAIAMSPEHRRLQRSHHGTGIGLHSALRAALIAERRALLDPPPHPAGPAPLFHVPVRTRG